MKRFAKSDPNPPRILPILVLSALVSCAACGYHIAGSVGNLPEGVHSLGIPTFKNNTHPPQYRLEQQITAAVLKEFALRTRIPISSKTNGVDAVLQGEIRNLNSSPITFGTDAFASAFLVTVEMSAKLVRVKDGAVLWENPSFSFQARYELNTKVTQFFSEENAAVDRLARDFAASLASSILIR